VTWPVSSRTPGGDTGIAHLATGYRTPSVLLFGPTPPAWWGPLLDRHLHRVLWHEELFDTAPRRAPRAGWREPHPALAAITVEEVLAAVAEVGAVPDTVR
jgi:ADP-heptose:LPS heptosyltransferase